MPKILISFFFLFRFITCCQAQENCEVDKFIRENHSRDAQKLAAQEMRNIASPFHDSVLIPENLQEKYLKILTTAYHIERNPFIGGGMHSKGSDSSRIVISISKTFSWAKKFTDRKGGLTFNKQFDDLMKKYNLKVYEAKSFDKLTYRVVLGSKDILNEIALENHFLKIKGITHGFINPLLTDKQISSYIQFDSNTSDLILFRDGYGVKKWKYHVLSPCRLLPVKK